MDKKEIKTMFSIDLLKGRGIPLSSGPAGIAIAVITAAVPIIIAIAFFGLYLHNKVTVSLKQRQVALLEVKAAELSDAVQMQRALEKEKIHYDICLSEVKSSISKFAQWSSVLTTLLENMPNSMVLTSLTVEQDSMEKEISKQDDPQKKITINVAANRLRLSVSDGGHGDCLEAVKEYRDRLLASEFLGPRLESVTYSLESNSREGKNIVSYEINCLFKPES